MAVAVIACTGMSCARRPVSCAVYATSRLEGVEMLPRGHHVREVAGAVIEAEISF
jgi:hypothetical protein